MHESSLHVLPSPCLMATAGSNDLLGHSWVCSGSMHKENSIIEKLKECASAMLTLTFSKVVVGMRLMPSSMLMLWLAMNCSGMLSMNIASSGMICPMMDGSCWLRSDPHVLCSDDLPALVAKRAQ